MIEVDGRSLKLDQLLAVARGREGVVLAAEAERRVSACWGYLWKIIREGTPVYGVTTGFGALDGRRVSLEHNRAQQRNLLMSHAAGVGPPMSKDAVRAMLLLRINALASGVTGIQPATLDTLVRILNTGVHPIVPLQGSVSACGDLAPLAHLMLPLIGMGRAEYRGRILDGAEALRRAGIDEPDLKGRDGLALINGTEQATSIAALAVADAERLVEAAQLAAAMSLEALEAVADSFDRRLAEIKGHPGQMEVSRNLRELTRGSGLVHPPEGGGRLRDALSLRCVPQVLGAAKEALRFVKETVEREMNSASDNPIFFVEEGGVTSNSGNFHGQSIALAMDFLTTSMVSLAVMSERRVARLVDEKLNEGLPAFLIRPHDGNEGLHSGLMIAQYTAASLVAELRTVGPASIHSIPTGANSEDHVPMASIAARHASKSIHEAGTVIAIELLCAAQALDLRGGRPGRKVARAHATIREKVPFMDRDRIVSQDIEVVEKLVREGAFSFAQDPQRGQ